jgi:hypothetical protein
MSKRALCPHDYKPGFRVCDEQNIDPIKTAILQPPREVQVTLDLHGCKIAVFIGLDKE